jgi:hypothetical protein
MVNHSFHLLGSLIKSVTNSFITLNQAEEGSGKRGTTSNFSLLGFSANSFSAACSHQAKPTLFSGGGTVL